MPVTSATRVRGGRAFLTGMFVDALGSGLYVPLTLLFIHEVTGLSMAVVGLGVTVAAAAGLAANPVAGILIDRFDARSVLVGTFLAASGQLLVRRLQRAARRTHSLALGGAVLIAACGAYAATALLPPGPVRIGGLVAATIILTVGELMHTVPSWGLAAGTAPPAMRGRYLAIYQLTWAVAAVVAPAGFSALLTTVPALLWATLGVLLAAAALTVIRLARRLPAEAVMVA
ncbi:hypothetical protein ACIBHY_25945 [Nonomuraea sp. NPDC050547]|uniref:hypothetical protein n=1 Tax=Nonomuraea sp. NPDC050547 TaxID=3364368 RepID=UPI0037927AB7